MDLKILQVGDFRFDYYDHALYDAFYNNSKTQVDKFEWQHYFLGYSYDSFFQYFYFSFENRYKIGTLVKKINKQLLEKVQNGSYDIVFLWRAIHIFPETIKQIQQVATVIGYNNDQTFSEHHPWWLFRLLKKSIPYYDHFFVYRSSDIKAINQLGTAASVFMPTFDKERIYPIKNLKQKFDVTFVGHYENDGRDELLLKLIHAGFKLSLKGQRWSESRNYKALTNALGHIVPAYDDYNESLNSARVCLSFLSKLNNDTYTRRTLEIPATNTVMLAEYTDEQAKMFEPDREAVYFYTHEEAIQKLTFLIENPIERDKIAQAGYEKVMNGSYQLSDRVEEILATAEKCLR